MCKKIQTSKKIIMTTSYRHLRKSWNSWPRAQLLNMRPICLKHRNSVQPTEEFKVSRQNLLDKCQEVVQVGSGQFSSTKHSGYHIYTK
jgi:hypothetical protein